MTSISNFHTHTKLCKHAEGIPADYVQQAKKEGCTALGFSDHCPYPESFYDYWPHIRMAVKEIPQYLSWIEECKKDADFPIYTGYECEWDKNISSWYSDELKGTYKAQYLVLGSHWVTDGKNHVYAPDIDNAKLLNKYIDQTIDAMQSKNFAFLAHPDLFLAHNPEWTPQAKSCSIALITAAKELNMPLEINGLGSSRMPNNTTRGMRYQYPVVEFWEIAAEEGIKIICNADAHSPADVIFNAWKARDFASRFNIKPIENLQI
ncbi:MAG: histidinol-phosphatase [Treponema sp.]|nr:histidinol-phosphatase [Treponema sp.]